MVSSLQVFISSIRNGLLHSLYRRGESFSNLTGFWATLNRGIAGGIMWRRCITTTFHHGERSICFVTLIVHDHQFTYKVKR
jgi:hypothetical protein